MSLDVLPADVPAEYAPAMVAACSDAIAEGSCAMASTLPESTRPDALGLVLWQGEDYLQVTVRVGRGNGQWVQRALTFSERDSISERFTTVGLTVATLVGETKPQPEPSPTLPAPTPAPEPVRPEPVKPKPAAQSPQPTRDAFFRGQLAAMFGPSWDGANWQKGAWVSVGFRIPRSPIVFHGFGSYALSSGPVVRDVDLSSTSVMGGVGAGLGGTWDALSVHGVALLELGVRRIGVEVDGQTLSDTEVPFRVRVSASFPAQSRVGFVAGAALRIPPGSNARSDAQQLVGPAVDAELSAGLEVRL